MFVKVVFVLFLSLTSFWYVVIYAVRSSRNTEALVLLFLRFTHCSKWSSCSSRAGCIHHLDGLSCVSGAMCAPRCMAGVLLGLLGPMAARLGFIPQPWWWNASMFDVRQRRADGCRMVLFSAIFRCAQFTIKHQPCLRSVVPDTCLGATCCGANFRKHTGEKRCCGCGYHWEVMHA